MKADRPRRLLDHASVGNDTGSNGKNNSTDNARVDERTPRVSEAQAYSWLGRTQVQLATMASAGEAKPYWRDGRKMFQQALAIWKDLRGRDARLPMTRRTWMKRFAR